MRDKMKIIAIVCIVACLLLSGCTLRDKNDISPEEEVEQIAEEVMTDLQNSRLDNIENLFSEKIKSNFDLEEEILALKNFINGEIESYDCYRGNLGGTTYDLGIAFQRCTASIKNVMTDSNHQYNICVHYVNIGEDDEIGVSCISIKDVDAWLVASDSDKEGTFMEVGYPLGYKEDMDEVKRRMKKTLIRWSSVE